MPRKGNDATAAALRKIAKAGGGMLSPDAVVDAAASEKSPLHSWFTWDDTEAAHQYRLEQARYLIRVHVEILHPKAGPSQTWVSLQEDRNAEGGYRSMVEVMSDDELRASLLEQAKDEMRRFAAKYRHLTELAEVISAIDKAS